MVINRFKGFIDKDSNLRYPREGSHRHALNMQRSTETGDSGGLTNELDRKAMSKIGGTIVGYLRLEERNQTLFFHVDGGSAISLFNHSDGVVTKVVTDTDFGCTWGFEKCQWIGYGHSTSKTIAPCNELIVYFASKYTYYKVNIDEMLAPKRKEAIKTLEEPCEYFKLIKCISGPRLKLRTLKSGGKDLAIGQYFAVARFSDESGNTSNWSVIEGPAYIGSKFNRFDTSKQAIRIECRNLNKEYSRIEIAIIPPVGSATSGIAYKIFDGSYSSNGAEVTYYSPSQHGEAISLAEILVKDIKYIRGMGMVQDEGKLHLFQTLQEFNPDLQREYNKAQVFVDVWAVPADKAHMFKEQPRDEVIAIAAQPMYCDQTFGPAFHIPGRSGGSNNLSCACDAPPGHTDNNATLVKEHVKLVGSGEEWCFIGGQQTTENEGYSPIQECAEDGIEPRTSDDDNACVDQHTDRKATQDKIDAIQSDNNTVDSCLDCAGEDVKADLDQTQGFFVQKLEQATDLFRTDEEVASDCTIGDHTSVKAAAKTLYNEAIVNAEKDEEIQYRTSLEKTGGTNLQGGNTTRTVLKGDDCVIEEVQPILLQTWTLASWESELNYPLTKNCEGEYHYGELAGRPIRHCKMPSADLIPLTITNQTGVENRHDPSNVPGKDTMVVMLSLRVENVYIPSYEKGEIPKPLDKNTPVRIVQAKLDHHNRSVLYRGYFTHTYKGKIGGKEYAVPRAGVNAYPACDQSIDNEGSHLGEDWTLPIYNFHSPDAQLEGGDITGTYVRLDGIVHGDGWVYEQYAKGKKVKEEENRKDRRGMRGAVNLNNFTANLFQTCINGIEHVEFNSSLQNPDGIEYPILNKHRESSIALQTAEPFPTIGTNNKDHSCNGGGLDHEYPTDGVAWYGAIKRVNKQQYGSVESLQYIDIGLRLRAGETSVSQLTGVCFLQKWSHKRTNFFSDKVGNYLNEDYPITATEEFLGSVVARKRGVCDPPNRRGYRMKEFMGFWIGQVLPENGDKKDPKNMANMHPTKAANQLNNVWAAETDLFFPRTFTCLNHLFVETDINLHYRATSEAGTRDVFYEELQGLDVDSSIHGVDPEDAWLNDFHSEQLQASDKQARRKILLRVLLTLGVPALMGWGVGSIDTPLQAGFAMFSSPFIVALWMLAVYNIFSPKKIDKFLGIPQCKIDSEGAEDEDNLRGLRDNFLDYNYGFSAVNDLNIFVAMPFVYNTCKCEKRSNVIYSSNRQIHTSPLDAYSNFQALSFTGIPADAGLLQNIVVYGNQVFAHTTDGIYLLQQKNVSIPTSLGEQLLGSSAFIENPTKIAEGAYEGFSGTEEPNSAIISRHGYLFRDTEAKTFMLFNGKFARINHKLSGLYEFMKDYSSYCSDGCKDQLTPEGIHWALGYDPERELFLFTKHDSKPWTYSYDIEGNYFVSEHSYTPDFYFWDRAKLFSVENGQIYRHNEEGSYLPCSVDVVTAADKDFEYTHTQLDTEVNEIVSGTKPTLFDRPKSFNYITAFNRFQTTGRLPVELNDQDIVRNPVIKIDRAKGDGWHFNSPRSNEIDRNIPIISYDGCKGDVIHNDANVTFENTAHTAKKIRGRYLIYRLEHLSTKDQIILHKIITNGDT